MLDSLKLLLSETLAAISHCSDLSVLEQIRVEVLGKNGNLTGMLRGMKDVPDQERASIGMVINDTKQGLQQALADKKIELEQVALNKKLLNEKIDVSMPGRYITNGTLHPLTQTINIIQDLFRQIGFCIVEGPEVETEYYNFTALNTPQHHPARAMHDTFYLDNGMLLRSHTSPVQIRAMLQREPPVRIIAPGRVYRCDSDVTHTPMFHQIEGLMVDTDTSFADLHGILLEFLQQFFHDSIKIRFRPSYFPFTEPSAEVDISCVYCDATGCRICKDSGWLEVLGCGMVHPNVLKAVNIDPQIYSGFAFGLGIERFAMLRYAIPDIRMNFVNDLRFLSQF